MSSDIWMIGHEVELGEMLDGREKRAAMQQALFSLYHNTVICFTLNIAGPVKVTSLTREVFLSGCVRIRECLLAGHAGIRLTEVRPHHYGDEAYFIVDKDPLSVKKMMVGLEDADPVGRLYDIDVLWQDGSKVSRGDIGMSGRTCLLCGRPAAECARNRTHSVRELTDRTCELICAQIRRDGLTSGLIGSLCRTAMLHEVYTTPKPGLVDRNNTGAHRDMDIPLFESSAKALEGYFVSCTEEGEKTAAFPADQVLKSLRPLGLKAEETMYAATGGVNTHKGLIFSLGIMCCALGRLREQTRSWTTGDLLKTAGDIARPALDEDLRSLPPAEEMTAGQRGYAEYGISGIRGEAASGFRSVTAAALPALEKWLDEGKELEESGARVLPLLIRDVNDTNMIKRCGLAGTRKLQEKIADALDRSPWLSEEELIRLDEEFIAKNASPGGCADLLAIAYFLVMIRQLNGE